MWYTKLPVHVKRIIHIVFKVSYVKSKTGTNSQYKNSRRAHPSATLLADVESQLPTHIGVVVVSRSHV